MPKAQRRRNVIKSLGGKCKKCKSEFELTLHHDRQPSLNRFQKTDKHVIVLCVTCHFQIDFAKTMACYPKAVMKRYNLKMDQMEMKK